MEKTCWYKEECCNEMIRGARGELWPTLDKSNHWYILEDLLRIVYGQTTPLLLDLGCGAGDLQNQQIVRDRYEYYGADLSNVINNVALEMNPRGEYVKCDVIKDMNIDFISIFDVVVMNALIDVMEHPIYILGKILKQCKKYVIIHRQNLTEKETYITTQTSYGGITNISHINKKKFFDIISRHKFDIISLKKTGLTSENHSLLLKRRETYKKQ